MLVGEAGADVGGEEVGEVGQGKESGVYGEVVG